MYDNLDIYYNRTENNNMIYSVDKIRLKTYISYTEFNELEFFINTYFKDKIKKFWLSDKRSSFHYNYNIEVGEGKSFLFQFMHNTEDVNYEKPQKQYNFSIEFNPNKLRRDYILTHILDSFGNWLLRSFDLAIDIPINILDLIIDKSGKHKMHFYSNGGDDITYYIGSKENDGSIKIYNKKKESNLNVVGNLTRVEVTRRYDDFAISNIKNYDFGDQFLPCIYLNQYVFSFSDYTSEDKTTMALLYAVQSGYSLNDLTKTYRKKIKEMLMLGSKVQFDRISATQAFCQCIFYYFVTSRGKQVLY